MKSDYFKEYTRNSADFIEAKMYIPRIYNNLGDFTRHNKVLIIFGPRQVGKTTLIRHYLAENNLKARFETGDNYQTREILSSLDLARLKEYIAGYDYLIVDEAQRVPEIGLALKLLVDHVPDLKIMVTGSSSFELAGQVGEPLTGRKITLTLYPISQLEMLAFENPFDLKAKRDQFLIYGSYPEIVTAENDKIRKQYITEMANSYLLKDVLELEKVKNPRLLMDLLKLLAFQVGQLVSHSELGQKLGIDAKTVARYLDLLEKSFVIYELRGYSRNLRNEISKKNKYYFYDTGVRNALIANFNNINSRDDVGQLWENWLVIERIKRQTYQQNITNFYFWRTWEQHEIDFVEERDGALFGFEFKWNSKAKVKEPTDWKETYPEASFQVINTDNYIDFVG